MGTCSSGRTEASYFRFTVSCFIKEFLFVGLWACETTCEPKREAMLAMTSTGKPLSRRPQLEYGVEQKEFPANEVQYSDQNRSKMSDKSKMRAGDDSQEVFPS